MRKQWLGIITFAALVSGFSGSAATAPPDDLEDVPLTLSGCVVAGEKADSFLLSNVEIDGTTLAPVRAFYRFNTTDGLKHHVGRRVEVKGKADLDDVDRGEIRTTMHDGRMTTEIRSERRTVRVEDLWFGSLGSIPLDADVPSYKFKVERIRPLEGNCAGARRAS
ncbi:MAG: hypothetical protein EHM55_12760 [Acidobacteria bacterium]|nr:MAG: hypothetical protein EHM55_12760 [Acidobacteriota bacterium]